MFTPRRLGLLSLITMLFIGLLMSACTPITPEAAPSANGAEDTTAEDTAAATTPSTTAAAATDTAPATAVGIYKGIFPGASSPGLDATLYLNGDGSMRLVSDYLNEEPPIVETGTWTADDATITLAGDQATDAISATLTLEDNQLVAENWIGPWLRFDALAQGMTPPYDAEMAAQMIEERGFLGYYKMFAPAANCCGRDMTLLLGIEEMAQLTSDYLNGEAPIVETGTWTINDDGSVTVQLTGHADGTIYEAPVTLVLVAEDGMLNATDYDQGLYGSQGLSFYSFPVIALTNVQAMQ